METTANVEQIEYWDQQTGKKWVALQERLDAQLAPLGRVVLDRLGVGSGAHVLDIGCGCGATCIELASRVGRDGQVLGIDVSTPMLARARERTRDLPQVSLQRADAQTHRFDAERFDVAFSRFGVMFFDDPRAAFTNVRRALRRDGRFGFACWQAATANEWVRVALGAILEHLPMPSIPPPRSPGPFAFAERDYVHGLLDDAGFANVVIEPHEMQIHVAGRADLDQSVEFLLQIGPAARALRDVTDPEMGARVAATLREALSPFSTPDGVRLGGAMWIVNAQASAR